MSDSEDSDILADIRADIKALDEVLTCTNNDKPTEPAYSRGESSDTDSDHDDDFIFLNQNIDESQDAYEINKRLINGLMITKKKLIALLEDCENKIEQLDEKIKMSTDESSEPTRLLFTTAGMPYFKDKNNFSAPRNYDTKLKESRGELFLLNLSKPCRWTAKDREMLSRAIHNEAIESVLAGDFNKEIDEKSNEEAMSESNKSVVVLPRNFTEMVGNVGEREFDWYKIAATDFENKHSPGECRSMWNVYLHPSIKKSEWTNAEDKALLHYTKECKYQDWDTIATKLGTKRSSYQCFIRYNTIKKLPSSGCFWTKQEDKHLSLVLNRLKIGNYIPWSEVATYLPYRTKQQVYTRWVYRKAPHLRKGRFTYLETETLMKAVKKYGTNFRKISNVVMPHRTSIQLNERYRTLITSKQANIWTVNDDKRLIDLHAKYGNDWSKIATYFGCKTRTQVRHRHRALLKYLTKGVKLEDIFRQTTSVNSKNIGASSSKELQHHNNIVSYHIRVSDILPRLYETLYFPLTIKTTTNSQELYNLNQLRHETRQLYNILKMLGANLDIPDDLLNYTHLNRKGKQLLVSLQKYINAKNNIQNSELIKEFRLRMFGPVPKISENARFIPPLPFDGYVRKKKIKKTNSINCNLNLNEHFLMDVPTEMIIPSDINSFLTYEEKIQFHKISKLLISDYNCNEQEINLHKSRSKSSFDEERESALSKYSKPNTSSKTRLKECETRGKQSNKLKKATNTEHINEDNKEISILSNIILPSHATLLGLKNLLLWKLLYEYQNESYLTSQAKINMEETENSETEEIESSEYEKAYQKLRTRLIQLFKFPVGLSNTILHAQGPETIFLTKKVQNERKNIMKKKSENNMNAKSADYPTIRSCKAIRNKYKIVAK